MADLLDILRAQNALNVPGEEPGKSVTVDPLIPLLDPTAVDTSNALEVQKALQEGLGDVPTPPPAPPYMPPPEPTYEGFQHIPGSGRPGSLTHPASPAPPEGFQYPPSSSGFQHIPGSGRPGSLTHPESQAVNANLSGIYATDRAVDSGDERPSPMGEYSAFRNFEDPDMQEAINNAIASNERYDKRGDRFMPFYGGMRNAWALGELVVSTKRIFDGEGSEDDYDLFARWMLTEHDNSNKGFWSQVWDTVETLPVFAAEFGITAKVAAGTFGVGGAAIIAKKLGTVAAKKLFRRQLTAAMRRMMRGRAGRGVGSRIGARMMPKVGQLSGHAARLSMQTLYNPQLWTQSLARDFVDDFEMTETEAGQLALQLTVTDPNWGGRMVKAFADAGIEILSERGGDILRAGGKAAKNAIIKKMGGLDNPAVQRAVNRGIMRKWREMFPSDSRARKLLALMKKGGIHSPLEEILEEEAGKALRTGILGDEYVATTMDEYFVMGTAFSVLPLGQKAFAGGEALIKIRRGDRSAATQGLIDQLEADDAAEATEQAEQAEDLTEEQQRIEEEETQQQVDEEVEAAQARDAARAAAEQPPVKEEAPPPEGEAATEQQVLAESEGRVEDAAEVAEVEAPEVGDPPSQGPASTIEEIDAELDAISDYTTSLPEGEVVPSEVVQREQLLMSRSATLRRGGTLDDVEDEGAAPAPTPTPAAADTAALTEAGFTAEQVEQMTPDQREMHLNEERSTGRIPGAPVVGTRKYEDNDKGNNPVYPVRIGNKVVLITSAKTDDGKGTVWYEYERGRTTPQADPLGRGDAGVPWASTRREMIEKIQNRDAEAQRPIPAEQFNSKTLELSAAAPPKYQAQAATAESRRRERGVEPTIGITGRRFKKREIRQLRIQFPGAKMRAVKGGAIEITTQQGRTLRVIPVKDLHSDSIPVLKKQGEAEGGGSFRGVHLTLGDGVALDVGEFGVVEANHVIMLATGADVTTIPHEAFHAAMVASLSPSEIALLYAKHAPGLGPPGTTDADEAVAEAYGRFMAGEFHHPLMHKIKQFFGRIFDSMFDPASAEARRLFESIPSRLATGGRLESSAAGAAAFQRAKPAKPRKKKPLLKTRSFGLVRENVRQVAEREGLRLWHPNGAYVPGQVAVFNDGRAYPDVRVFDSQDRIILPFGQDVIDEIWNRTRRSVGAANWDAYVRTTLNPQLAKEKREQFNLKRPLTLEALRSALDVGPRSRFWYEEWESGLREVFPDMTQKNRDKLSLLLAATSPQSNVIQNTLRALSIMNAEVRGRPAESGFMSNENITRALQIGIGKEQQHKIGSFLQTEMFLAGRQNIDPPMPVLDVIMAQVFGVPKGSGGFGTGVTYQLFTEFMTRLTHRINQDSVVGTEPWQVWQLQAALWMDNNETGATYSQGFAEAARRIEAAGITLPRATIRGESIPFIPMSILKKHNLQEILETHLEVESRSHVVTMEAGTVLTEAGQRTATLFDALRNASPTTMRMVNERETLMRRHDRFLTKSMRDLVKDGAFLLPGRQALTRKVNILEYLQFAATGIPVQHTIGLEKMRRRRQFVGTVTGEGMDVHPSGQRAMAASVGHGTWKNSVSPNLRFPMLPMMSTAEREFVLGVLGRAYSQEAVAASHFRLVRSGGALHGGVPTFGVHLQTHLLTRENVQGIADAMTAAGYAGNSMSTKFVANGSMVYVVPDYDSNLLVPDRQQLLDIIEKGMLASGVKLEDLPKFRAWSMAHTGDYIDQAQYPEKVDDFAQGILNAESTAEWADSLPQRGGVKGIFRSEVGTGPSALAGFHSEIDIRTHGRDSRVVRGLSAAKRRSRFVHYIWATREIGRVVNTQEQQLEDWRKAAITYANAEGSGVVSGSFQKGTSQQVSGRLRQRRQEVHGQDLEGDGRATAAFFADVAEGKRDKSDVPYVPVMSKGPRDSKFDKAKKRHAGNFDDHIGKSIPGYYELQTKVGVAVSRSYPDGAVMADLGASDGSLIKAITETSDGKVRTVGVDASPTFARLFREQSKVPGSIYDLAAFGVTEGWKDEVTGEMVKPWAPGQTFDVIHEAMLFQFISNTRSAQIKEMKRHLKDDGVIILEEKFAPETGDRASRKLWEENEDKKDEHKSKYFEEEELKKKKEEVLGGGEDALEGMHSKQVTAGELESILSQEFDHVVQFWDGGNFKGYIASNNAAAVEKFISNLSDTNTTFANVTVPRQVPRSRVQEGSFQPAPPLRSTRWGRFFGKSVLVDEDGEPLVWFHGTAVPIFGKSGLPGLSSWGLYGPGLYHTSSPDIAGGYSGMYLWRGQFWKIRPAVIKKAERIMEREKIDPAVVGKPTPRMLATFVRIERPLDMDERPDADRWIAALGRMRDDIMRAQADLDAYDTDILFGVDEHVIDSTFGSMIGTIRRNLSGIYKTQVQRTESGSPLALMGQKEIDNRRRMNLDHTTNGDIFRFVFEREMSSGFLSGMSREEGEQQRTELANILWKQMNVDGLVHIGGLLLGEGDHRVAIALDHDQVRTVHDPVARDEELVQKSLTWATEFETAAKKKGWDVLGPTQIGVDTFSVDVWRESGGKVVDEQAVVFGARAVKKGDMPGETLPDVTVRVDKKEVREDQRDRVTESLDKPVGSIGATGAFQAYRTASLQGSFWIEQGEVGDDVYKSSALRYAQEAGHYPAALISAARKVLPSLVSAAKKHGTGAVKSPKSIDLMYAMVRDIAKQKGVPLNKFLEDNNIDPQLLGVAVSEQIPGVPATMDAYDYAFREGHIRASGSNFEMEGISSSRLRELARGIKGIVKKQGEAGRRFFADLDDKVFNVENRSPHAFYQSVPWAVIEKGDMKSLRDYRLNIGGGSDTIQLSGEFQAASGETNRRYMELAKDPEANREELQELVDVAAKDAGYSLQRMFHGTQEVLHTIFDPDKGDSLGGVNRLGTWWTSKESLAENFAGKKGRVHRAYLKGAWASELSFDDLDQLFRYILKRTRRRALHNVKPADVTKLRQDLRKEGKDTITVQDTSGDKALGGDFLTQYTVVLDSTQIKSAEPVTRDDAGNVIPLSKRFDVSMEDSRFQAARRTEAKSEEELWEELQRRHMEKGDEEEVDLADAIPGLDPEAVAGMRAVDEMRNMQGRPVLKEDAETFSRARKLMEDPEALEKKLTWAYENNQTLNSEETYAARLFLRERVMEAVKSKDPVAIRKWIRIANTYRDIRAEQARALRIGQDFEKDPSKRHRNMVSETLIRPNNSEKDKLRKIDSKMDGATSVEREQLKGEKEEVLRDQAVRIAQIKQRLKDLGLDLDNEDNDWASIRFTTRALRTISTAHATGSDMLYEWFIASLLWAPITQIRNISGNTAFSFWEHTFQRLSEVAVNKLIPVARLRGESDRDYKKRSREVRAKSAMMQDFKWEGVGLWHSFTKAAQNGLMAFEVEAPTFAAELRGTRGSTKFDYDTSKVAIPGQVGRVVSLPLRFLVGMDEYAKTTNGHIVVYMVAARQATAEGLSSGTYAHTKRTMQLVNNPHSKAWTVAIAEADRLAFQERAGGFGQGLLALRQFTPGARYAFTFITTPLNIFKVGFKKSPLGVINMLYKGARHGHANLKWKGKGRSGHFEYTREQLVIDSAEQVLALGALAVIAAFAMPDDDELPLITGTAPVGPRSSGERDLAYRVAPPTSFRFPFTDTWWSYAGVEPLAVSLSSTVDVIMNIVKASNDSEADKISAAMGRQLSSLMNQVQDKTFMRGMRDLMTVFSQPEKGIARYVSNFAAAWVPNIVRAGLREAGSEVRYQKFAEEDLSGFWGKQTLRTLQNAFPAPFVSPPPKVDMWGNVVKKGGAPLIPSPPTDWLWRMLSPVRKFNTKLGPEQNMNRMMLNWNLQNPSDILAPRAPDMWLTYRGEKVLMTDEEYHDFMIDVGETSLKRAERRKQWNFSKPTLRDKEALLKLVNDSRRQARQRLLVTMRRAKDPRVEFRAKSR